MTNKYIYKISRNRLIIIAILFYLLGVIFYSLWSYYNHKTELENKIDQTLTKAATSIDYLVPMGYFDRAIGPDSISKIEYLEIMELLNKQAENMGVIYIYSVARSGSNIYFTTSNATKEEMLTGENLTTYWLEYSEADTAFYNSFDRDFRTFSKYTDRWGTFKTILIPRVTENGNKYVLCADIEISFIKDELWTGIIETIYELLFLLLLVIPFIIILFINYRRYATDLAFQVSQRTQLLEQEIQKRINSEEILKQSEEKFSIAFKHIPVPMYIMDMAGIIVEINKAFEEITGLVQSKAKGHFILSLPFFESAKDFEKIRNMVQKQGSLINLRINYRNKTEIRSCNYSAVLIQINGSPHMLSVAFDVSERMKYETELKKAKEKAEESDRLKSNFLANMSHEVRTPLNAVIGFSELLRDEALTLNQRNEYIDIVTANSRNLLELINDIIDISKIEAGQLKITESESNINKLLNQLYRWVDKERIEKGKNEVQIKLSISLPEEKAFLLTDEVRVRQVLVNLLTNALKFTSKGQVEFGYVIQQEDIHFFVKDTGIGIDKTSLQSIFERFKQAEEGAARKYGGTGLGLAISKAITELMGGTIWVDSQPGIGSSFYFTIPYKPLESKDVKNDVNVKKPGLKVNLKGKNILVVEDDEPSIFFLKTILNKSGAEVIQAKNGEEALAILNSRTDIHMALMDLHLPGMTGCDIAVEIRKNNPDIPLIAQTADALGETRKHAFICGFNEYLTKPLNKDLLFELISKYLTQKDEKNKD